ncbi:MAG: Peptidyl-prolyl cis-trans isomerase [Candidatus Woesebacteria bacterium GW2011_GWB1_41_10]|uniref:Peptidyl-prolyl cis-trans isomerase n=1 Tax=Candidatus Woesebacteria bacterium GW2011_GWB1_41_10 TaxID=1618577 RepID=A0A0G0UCS9_9BACT|nr:MAG: Peptidyl-prolyl cis-trans isomerase [Candidatus Woesebacteria bacterium GW2011_GWB1_41_10]
MNEENKMGFEWGKFALFILSFVLVFGGVMLLDKKLNVGKTNSVEEAQEQLKIEDIVVGAGDEAVSGKKVTVHYTGTLTDGTKFDSSLDRGTPFTFSLGAGEVIQGWDQGVAGMKVGGKRKLTIPSSLGYGETGAGDTIPPNATLVFEIELLKVE